MSLRGLSQQVLQMKKLPVGSRITRKLQQSRKASRSRGASGRKGAGRAASRVVWTRHKTVFLDLDDTLLDTERFLAEFRLILKKRLGKAGAERYWKLVKRSKAQRGYPDYLEALRQYRLKDPCEVKLLSIVNFLLEYPFEERLCRDALKAIRRIKRAGLTPVLL